MLFEQIESAAVKRHDRRVGIHVAMFFVDRQNPPLVGGPAAVGSNHRLHRRAGALAHAVAPIRKRNSVSRTLNVYAAPPSAS